jgi:hypothetical protein
MSPEGLICVFVLTAYLHFYPYRSREQVTQVVIVGPLLTDFVKPKFWRKKV